MIRRVPGVMDPDMRGMNVSGRCHGKTVNWLVDTGALTSLLSLDVWRSLDGGRRLEPTKCRMTTAAGKEIVVYGTVEVPVDFGSCCLPMKVTVVKMQPEAILGMDTMSKWGVNVNFKRKELEVEDRATLPEDSRSGRKTQPVRAETGYNADAGERASQKTWQRRRVGDVLGQAQGQTAQDRVCCVRDRTEAGIKVEDEDHWTKDIVGPGGMVHEEKWKTRKVGEALGKSQERTVKDRVCCVKDSTVADAKFGGVDVKSDDLSNERREMDCKMSGCDLRDIPEVAREAMDVKDPVHDMEGHTQEAVDLDERRKMVQDTSGCDPRYIPEVARKAMDVKDPVHDMEGHTQEAVDLDERRKMVQDTSGCDPRYIPEVTRKAMDVTDPVCDLEGHTPMMEVFWKEEQRENGQKDSNDKCKCRDQKILTNVGMYQTVGLGPPGGICTGMQFHKGIG